jgi:diadenosine tetraphosphate (Ap4A) HIT family hydrolase
MANQCIFCNKTKQKIISSNESFFVVRDSYPVTKYHSLIISHRHISNFFDLSDYEFNNLNKILKKERQSLLDLDKDITAFNVGVNSGVDAGQSIMHCHIHIIPRRKGDIDNPKGGVRGVISSKQKYIKLES